MHEVFPPSVKAYLIGLYTSWLTKSHTLFIPLFLALVCFLQNGQKAGRLFVRQKSLWWYILLQYEIIKLNRLENKVSFSNKCNEVSLDINFDERWYGRNWWCKLIMKLHSLRFQLESSVIPSPHPDWNIHSKGSMFFYLVAICSLNSWYSFVVWSYSWLDYVVSF